MPGIGKLENIATVGFFLSVIIGISALSINAFTKPASELLTSENRAAAELPKVTANFESLRAAPAKFEKYFIDRMALRTDMVAKRNLMLARAFAVSPSNGVLIGKDNWLYYMLDGDAQTLRHSQLFSPEELLSWKDALEQQHSWLAKHGIRYSFVLAPSKCTIYPEHIPAAYTLLNEKSRADQLVSYLKENTTIDVVDLRQPLIDKKSAGQLYFKTDTHWNKLGAMLASSALINHVRKDFPNMKPGLDGKEYTVTTKLVEHGDLVKLMGIDGLMTEQQPVLSREGGEGWKLSHNPPQPVKGDPRDAYKPLATQSFPLDTTLPKVVLFGDSFSVPLVAYLAPHFNRIYLDRDTRDKPEGRFTVDVIEKEKPDLVVQEITERKLMLPAPKNPRQLCEQLSESKSSVAKVY